MERTVLAKYKDRLINFGGRNQTLCRNKLYSMRAFDLTKLSKIPNNEKMTEEILLSLIKDDNKEHKILNRSSDIKLTKQEKNEIELNLKNSFSKKIILEEFSKEEIEILKNESDDKLLKKAINLLELDKLNKKIAYNHSLSKNLDRLFNEIDSKERETGLYELYLGYAFIEGKLLDGRTVRAPLFLFPSLIFKRDGEWYYKNLNKEKIYINKVFLMAYKDSNNVSIDHITEEYEEVEDFFNLEEGEKIKTISEFITKCKQWGEKNKIIIKNDFFSDNFEIMKDIVKSDYEIYQDGDLYLKNHFILGQYSVGANSIYKDIEKMIENELPESVKSFLTFDTETVTNDSNKNSVNSDFIEIKEKESFFVTELDYSQEKAVKMAEKLKNLVIYGPPGTGKSQVIANIVSDSLAKGKKVLVVSEKRTALDVVYKRLEKVGLDKKLAFVHDSKKDREFIMQKLINNYETAFSSDLLNFEIVNEHSNEIQTKINSLDQLAKELHLDRKIGTSLYKLYTNSNLNDILIDDIESNFSEYNHFNYNSLKILVKKLLEIKDYIIYDNEESLICNRKSFSDTTSLDERKLLELIKKLNSNLKNGMPKYHERLLTNKIKNIDITKIWEKENSNNIYIYENVEELSKTFTDYETSFFISLKKFKLKRKLKKFFKTKDLNEFKKLTFKILKEKEFNENLIKNISNETIDILEKANYILDSNLLTEHDNEEINNIKTQIILSKEVINNLSKYFNDNLLNYLLKSEESINLDNLVILIENEYHNIKNYDIKKKNFNDNENKILNHYIKNNNSNYIKNLESTYYIKWIENIENEIGQTLITIDEYEVLKEKTFKLIKDKKIYIPEYIETTLNDIIKNNFEYNRVGNEVYYRNLLNEAGKKRKKLSLRKFITLFKDKGIFDLLPCWLLTPEIVSEILPFEKEFFDIVIFDEASQMFVEKSMPTIYRAKNVIIAGDDKQLKPNAVGIRRLEEINLENNESDTEYIDETAIEVESLLDLAKERYKGTLLSYHYRSIYPELINFSNYAFYNGRLVTAPNKIKLEKPPIEFIKIDDGIWENQSNIKEAEKVYSLVKELLINRKNNESIGIVTFNAKQQNTIKDYLDDICENDIEFRTIYEQEKIRYDGTEDQSLFVKNIENVQGDERDIIIFSTAYAKDFKTGKVASRFGTLSQVGGENRLNVAISRAKMKIYLITSIEPEELNVENTKNDGPKLLKKYLQYARSVSLKNNEISEKLLNSLEIVTNSNIFSNDKFDSPFEIEVCRKLREKGYKVHTQVGDSGYRIDLAIYDEKNSDYILGIECDGATYHSSPSARERDIYRQNFLEMKGWNIHRIWSKKWWSNSQKEIDLIIKKLNNIQTNYQNYM